MTLSWNTIALVAVFTVAAQAHATTPASDTESVNIAGIAFSPHTVVEGLTITKTSLGVVGAWRSGDDVLFFAAARGPCKPLDDVVPATCPDVVGDDTARETDAVILDRHGIPFITAIGGDLFVDPAWVTMMQLLESRLVSRLVDPNLRIHDFERAAELGQLLTARGVQDSLELRAVRDLASTPDIDAFRAAMHPDPDVDGLDPYDRPPAIAGGTSEASPKYYHYIAQYQGTCCLYVAKHSATLTIVYTQAWLPVNYFKRGNHGRYHNETGMSWFCDWTSGLRSNAAPYISPYYSSDCFNYTCGGGCNTPYGPFGWQHVCNDDSHAQVGNVKRNGYKYDWWECADGRLNGYPDPCLEI